MSSDGCGLRWEEDVGIACGQKEEKERDGRGALNSQRLFGVLGMVGGWELRPRPRLSNLLLAPPVEGIRAYS